MSALRIHWCSPLDSGQQKASEKYDTGALDFAGIVDFAKEADELGIDSLLMGISYHMPDPLPMIGALVRETDRVNSFWLTVRGWCRRPYSRRSSTPCRGCRTSVSR